MRSCKISISTPDIPAARVFGKSTEEFQGSHPHSRLAMTPLQTDLQPQTTPICPLVTPAQPLALAGNDKPSTQTRISYANHMGKNIFDMTELINDNTAGTAEQHFRGAALVGGHSGPQIIHLPFIK